MIALFVACVLTPVQAQAFASTDSINLDDELCFLTNGAHLSDDAVFSASMDQFDCRPEALDVATKHIWIRADLSKFDELPQDAIVRTRLSHHGAITVRAEFLDGHAQTTTYSLTDLRNRWRAPNQVGFPISDAEGNAPERVYIGIEGSWDPLKWRHVSLMSQAADEVAHHRNMMLSALFIGLMLTPLLMDAIFFSILRKRFILFHAGMVAAAVIYVVTRTGVGFELFPWLDILTRSMINYSILTIAVLCSALLARAMTSDELVKPILGQLLVAFGALPVFVTMAVLFFIPETSYVGPQLYYASFAPMLALLLLNLSIGSLKGDRNAQLQLLGWLPLILFAGARVLHGLGLIHDNILLSQGMFPALLCEMGMTCLLVTAKVISIRRDRDRAIGIETELRRRVSTDDLTGLLNRRAFVEHYDQVVSASLGERSTACLLVIDIDHFKIVNDKHGHLAGDAALKQVADLIVSFSARRDAVSRVGGEEFAMLMLEGRMSEAIYRAERIRAAIEDFTLSDAAKDVKNLTISIGIVKVDGNADASFESYFNAADKALYAAKDAGRNCVRLSGWLPKPAQPNFADVPDDQAWVVKA